MRRSVLIVGALAVVGAATAADVPVTALPRPAFPRPVATVTPSGPVRLALVSSRYHEPGLAAPGRALPAWAPSRFHGAALLRAITEPGTMFLLYGEDGASARFLVAANMRTRKLRYAFDVAAFATPPRLEHGSEPFGEEQVVWAREAGGVLYVETAHSTYAQSSFGRNAYVAAIDLRRRRTRWRSPALVANAGSFVLAGDVLVTGYGFTRERDYLYLLDRRSGRVGDRLPLPSADERIVRHGDRLLVRTYDHDVVALLRPA